MEISTIKPIMAPTPAEAAVEVPTSISGTPMEQEAVKQEQEQRDPKKQAEEIQEAADKLNKTSVIFDRSLRFKVHTKTNETMVSVVDINSDKVIREIPAKEVLDLVSKMRDYLGMIFDKKA